MSRTTGRHFLQIPGPTNVPDAVLRAIVAPTIDHRGPDFVRLGLEVLEALGPVSATTQPVVVYPSSGTGAWEAALVNTLSPGDTVLAFETGHFATLWKAMATSRTAGLPRSYWDWVPIISANKLGYWPYTPATNLLYGLNVALGMLSDEGLDNVFARHQRHAAATREAVRAWGLEVICADERELRVADRRPCARRARRRRRTPGSARALRHVVRGWARQADRPHLPDRAPRPLQRPDARWHAVRGADGATTGRRTDRSQRSRGGYRPAREGMTAVEASPPPGAPPSDDRGAELVASVVADH